jgi:hypothetical protein
MSDAVKNAEREEEEHQTFEGVCELMWWAQGFAA